MAKQAVIAPSSLSTGPGERTGRNDGDAGPGMLAGLRVIEIADERAEYTGLLLAGLGAGGLREAPAREHLVRLPTAPASGSMRLRRAQRGPGPGLRRARRSVPDTGDRAEPKVTDTKIGTWPVYELPMKPSATPAYIGGPTNRGARCYGENNMCVLTKLLGRSPSEVERLAEGGR